MPQGWKSTSKIHQPISPSVRKQIDKREELLSQKSGRSNQQVMYLTSKTGWVKVSSAVNIQTGNPNEVVTVLVKPGQTEEFDGGSNKKAKANVLSGGLLNKKLKYRAGIFNTTNNSYNQENPGKGYRPVPGITGFQTQFAGTYGTLQKAVVQFQANSLDQLDLLESLYLRPGMSLLVEYGHSVYMDNQGEIQTNIKTVENFFELQGADGKETLQNRIKELRKESDHNYGGFFGTVQNYQWEINEDGTYTCSANIIAQGQLIESIGVIVYGPSKKKKEITPADIELDLAKNDFETFLVGILSGGQPTDIDHRKVSEETLEEIGKELPDLVNRFKKETEKNNRPLEVVTFTNVGDGEGNDIVKLIRMSNFLDLINVTLFMNAGNRSSSGPITKFYTGESDVTKNLTPYLTFFGHSSVNPTKCILGNLSKKSKFSVNFNYNGIERLASTDILDIFVSVEFIKNIFDDMVANETGKDQTILALVMRVLFGIKKSAGMVNDFDIYIDEDTDIQYVVDRKLVPEGTPPTINLFGQKSTARAFNISSKITSDLTTMIAIGASATNTDSSIDAMQMKQKLQTMEGELPSWMTQMIAVAASDLNDARDYLLNPTTESGILYRAGVKKYGKAGMKAIQSAAGKGASHQEIGKIKDKHLKDEENIDESVKDWARNLAAAGVIVGAVAGMGSIQNAIDNTVPAVKAMNTAYEMAMDAGNEELAKNIKNDISAVKVRLDSGRDLNFVKAMQEKYAKFIQTEGLAYESRLQVQLNQQLK